MKISRPSGRYVRKPTAKQRALLHELAQGKTNTEAAKALGRTCTSIGTEIDILCDIFKICTREELVQKANELEIEEPVVEVISEKQFLSELCPGLID